MITMLKISQEGQHPLTGQHAANFRLLANQWEECRLVTQWRHGCRAIRRSECTTCIQWGSIPLRSDIKGMELPPANILIPLERQYDCATTLPLTIFI